MKDFKEVWSGFVKILKRVARPLTKFIVNLNWKKIIKFFSIVSMIITGFAAFFEIVLVLILILDPEHVSEILRSILNIDIFQYINLLEYYLIIIGGFLIDMSFLSLLFIFALWLYSKKNLFKNIKIKIVWFSIFAIGSIIFAFGYFYAMPEIFTIKDKIKESHGNSGHHGCGRHFNDRTEPLWINNKNYELEMKHRKWSTGDDFIEVFGF